MKTIRDIGNALLVAFVSIGLIFGALSMSLVEFAPEETPTATFVIATETSVPPTFTPSPIPSPTVSTQTSTFTPIPTASALPTGTTPTLGASSTPSLTPQASATFVAAATKAGCTKGSTGWSFTYTVKAGDTLYNIGYQHYTTLDLMRRVNCRVTDTIYIGERMWVPITATRTPFPTITPYPTDPLTVTVLPFTVTYSPVPTSTPIPTETIPPPPTASFTPPSPNP